LSELDHTKTQAAKFETMLLKLENCCGKGEYLECFSRKEFIQIAEKTNGWHSIPTNSYAGNHQIYLKNGL